MQAEFQSVAARYSAGPSEWREDSGGVLQAVSLSARYADLVIVGQSEPGATIDSQVGAHFADDLVFLAPRPMLVVPYIGEFRTLGERVLLARNSSPNALRAVTGAIPLLMRAAEVSVIVCPVQQPGNAWVVRKTGICCHR